jgi:hypothetical protein
MELNHYHFPNDMFHTSRLLGQDIGVIKLGVVINVYAFVLSLITAISLDDKAICANSAL